ncbi:MarR family winged helix-turn-helix transcriptional regulator [Streptosporangium lutulentum]
MTQDALPEAQAAALLGREFATAIVVFHEAVGKLVGLSSVERKCIDVLQRLGPVTAGAIAEHTGLTTGAVTGLVDRLETAATFNAHATRTTVARSSCGYCRTSGWTR